MNLPQELDPRVRGFEKWVKGIGLAAVAIVASGVVVAVGASVIAAVAVGGIALVVVNFGIPVGARYIALKKQQALTKLAEVFSEDTIREDERQEGERIRGLEDAYTTSRAELEGAIAELHDQMKHATDAERVMLQSQIDTLQGVIESAEANLRQRKEDFVELQRVNKMYIVFYRSAAIMQKTRGAERDPEELQRLETARTSIKTRMRQAMAGKTVEAMNTEVQPKFSFGQVARIGNSQPVAVTMKVSSQEGSHVSSGR